MSYPYIFKVVVSGKQVEVLKYSKAVWRDFKKDDFKDNEKAPNEKEEEKPKELTEQEILELKKKLAKSSLCRTKTEIRRLTNANPRLNKFMTLTFAENITDLGQANYIFNQFIKRITYKYGDFEYLAVPEFQKRGAVHYHLLCNLPFIEVAELEAIWGQGFIKINKIDEVNNVGAYVCKYLSKDMFDERTFGKKKFFRSQTLSEAVILIGWWAMKFFNRVLQTLTPVFEKKFNSEWLGDVEYKAYSLDYFPFPDVDFKKPLIFEPI